MTINTVVVVGGGLTGWTCALALATQLKNTGLSVKLIETYVNDVGAESSMLSIRNFHSLMKVNELVLLEKAKANLSLGNKYVGFTEDQCSFYQTNSATGLMINNIEFQHYANLLKQCGDSTAFNAYSLSAVMSESGRFNFLSDEQAKDFSVGVSLQLKTNSYIGYIKELAIQRGVSCYQTAVASVKCHPESGLITSLCMDDGSYLSGDFFIDATESESSLINIMSPAGRLDLNHRLAFDRVLEVNVPSAVSEKITSSLIAAEHGCIKVIPFSDFTVVRFFYSHRQLTDEAAKGVLVECLPDFNQDLIKMSALSYFRRNRSWVKNCLAVGGSSFHVGDLFFSPLHLVQSVILRFIDLFPNSKNDVCAAEEFNRLCSSEYDRVFDYVQAHFILNSVKNSSVWAECKTLAPSNELQYKLRLFQKRGVIAFFEQETWMPALWISLLIGFNVWPDKYDFRIESLSVEQITSTVCGIKNEISELVDSMPEFDVFVKHLMSSQVS